MIRAVSLRSGKNLIDYNGSRKSEVKTEQEDGFKKKNKYEIPTRKKKDNQRNNEETRKQIYVCFNLSSEVKKRR